MWLPARAGAGDAAQASVLCCGVRVQFVLSIVTVTRVSRGATGTSTCSTCTGDGESTDAITTTRFVKSRGPTTYAPARTRLLALSESEGRAPASRRQRRACIQWYVLPSSLVAATVVVLTRFKLSRLSGACALWTPRRVELGWTRCRCSGGAFALVGRLDGSPSPALAAAP